MKHIPYIIICLIIATSVTAQVKFTQLERAATQWSLPIAKRVVPGISDYVMTYMTLAQLIDSTETILGTRIDSMKMTTNDTLALYTSDGIFKTKIVVTHPSDSTIVENDYGTIIVESPANTYGVTVDSTKFATPYDLTLINFIDSTNVLNSYGTTITESPSNTFNIKVDSTKFMSTYAGSLKVGGDGLIDRFALWSATNTLTYSDYFTYNSSLGTAGFGTTTPLARVHAADGDVWIIGGNNRRFLMGSSVSSGYWGGMRWNTSNQLQYIHSGYSDVTGVTLTTNSGYTGFLTAGTAPTTPVDIFSSNTSDGGTYQKWAYSAAPTSYNLFLKQTVTGGNVRYNFSQVNAGTAYDNVLVMDQGNVAIGHTDATRKVDINGELRVRDLTTTTPTKIVSADADGVVSSLGLSGLSISGGNLVNSNTGTVQSITVNAPLTTTQAPITTTATLGVDTTASTPSALATQHDISSKQNAISLTTTGTSGVSTFSSSVLNIPNYTVTRLRTGGIFYAGDLDLSTTNTGTYPGWDYSSAIRFNMPAGTNGQVLKHNGTGWTAGTDTGGSGTVTSVAISGSDFSISGSPITTSGTIGLSIASGVVGATELASTSVTAGSYTNTNLTVDADGRITAASSGSGISDGDKGDITVTSSGAVWNIDAGVVGQNEIATNGVGSDELASNSVASVEIVDGSVALADLATIPANRFIGSSTGAANIYLSVGTGNEIQSNQLTATTSHYGFLSDANGSVTSFAINTTPVKVDFDTPLTGLSGTMTVSSASDNITVTAAGGYEINYGVCISGVSATRQISIAIYKGGTLQSPTNKSFFITSGDEDCASGSHIMVLNASDVIDLRIATSASETVTLTGPQLSLKRLY